MSWRQDTRHDDGFIFLFLGFWNIGFKTKTMQTVQLFSKLLNNIMKTSQCHVMTSRYTSRWRLHFCLNPRPLKYRIQNKNNVIHSISSWDAEQSHDDITVSRHDARVCITMTISIYFMNVSHCTQNVMMTSWCLWNDRIPQHTMRHFNRNWICQEYLGGFWKFWWVIIINMYTRSSCH